MKPTTRRDRWIRGLKVGAAATVLFVGFVGFLHTNAGRPLLAAAGIGCPAMRVSPAEVESVRQRALTTLRGTTPASERPAFGLVLDKSTEAELIAWTKASGLACDAAARPTRNLTCRGVPASSLPMAPAGSDFDEVNFNFFPDGRLLGVETLRRHLSSVEAARLFTTITETLTAKIGGATERAGDATAAYLGGGAMHTAFARYRYSNYLATITAMNLSGRIALREQYQSALGPS
jgi:hypothetical protein